jgi:hypothetical protein
MSAFLPKLGEETLPPKRTTFLALVYNVKELQILGSG